MSDWKPVFNYENVYEVSSDGQVRRCDGYHKQKRILRPASNHHGYLLVSLSRDCKGKTFFVHRIVCEAFIGERPHGMTINHKNGNKTDNRIDNLEYLSHADNIKHANHILNTITPTRARGDRNGSISRPERLVRGVDVATAKLDEQKVLQVRKLLQQGLKQRDIAKYVGISQTQIWRINVGLSWNHVK